MQLVLEEDDEVVFFAEIWKHCPVTKYQDREAGQDSMRDIFVKRTCTTHQLKEFIPGAWRWACHFKGEIIPVPDRFKRYSNNWELLDSDKKKLAA